MNTRWLSAAFRMALLPVVFPLPAGTWRWWEAWVVAGIYLGWAMGISIYLTRRDPALLAERLKSSPVQKGQKGWDKLVLPAMVVAGVGVVAVPGLDVVRLGWSEPLPLWLRVTAMALHLPCFFVVGWVMHESTFLSRVVKIDSRFGLIPSAVMAALVVLRTALEDQTLNRELTGYSAYARITRYRLVPGLW